MKAWKQLVVFVLFVLKGLAAHPDLLDCAARPERVRDEGDTIMGEVPVADEDIEVVFLKNGVEMQCEDTFTELDVISVRHNMVGEYFVDVIGAAFANPNVPSCPRKLYKSSNEDGLDFEERDSELTSLLQNVGVSGAQAGGFGEVSFSNLCIIRRVETNETAEPTPTPMEATLSPSTDQSGSGMRLEEASCIMVLTSVIAVFVAR